ncbi:MAG: DUF1801 domain-containing protein [Burkholderiaceae bacterium]|nr:DUF1801 domain-containing protein [Burkholderiaceae bacterium]
MVEQKTKPTETSVKAYVDAIPDAARRADCLTLIELMSRATGSEPRMWGSSIVGFGSYHYRYASGHEGDAALIGFASRKSDLTLYITPGFDVYQHLLARLGKHRVAKCCLYLKRLADIDLEVLGELIEQSVREISARHPPGGA